MSRSDFLTELLYAVMPSVLVSVLFIDHLQIYYISMGAHWTMFTKNTVTSTYMFKVS